MESETSREEERGGDGQKMTEDEALQSREEETASVPLPQLNLTRSDHCDCNE